MDAVVVALYSQVHTCEADTMTRTRRQMTQAKPDKAAFVCLVLRLLPLRVFWISLGHFT